MKDMKELRKMTVGEIVADDFRAAKVFKNAGIDFCCGGDRSLEVAASEKKLNVHELELKLNKLDEMESESGPNLNFKDWNADFLSDYIVNRYHNKVYRVLPEIMAYLNKSANVHGNNHPELLEIRELFAFINEELPAHQRKEETLLFPAIKETVGNPSSERSKEMIRFELKNLKEEHDQVGSAMDKINHISNGYKVPADGCNTFRLTYQLLEEFEDDLHEHVHLENNILFPKALELTK